MLTIIHTRHVEYESEQTTDKTVIAYLSVAAASELPSPDGIPGFVLHEGSRAWNISTGDIYGLLANGTWVLQPKGSRYWPFNEV
jgi:hypothetical protein